MFIKANLTNILKEALDVSKIANASCFAHERPIVSKQLVAHYSIHKCLIVCLISLDVINANTRERIACPKSLTPS